MQPSPASTLRLPLRRRGQSQRCRPRALALVLRSRLLCSTTLPFSTSNLPEHATQTPELPASVPSRGALPEPRQRPTYGIVTRSVLDTDRSSCLRRTSSPTPAALSSSDTAARTSPTRAQFIAAVGTAIRPCGNVRTDWCWIRHGFVRTRPRSSRNDETASGTLLRLSARRGKTEHSQHLV